MLALFYCYFINYKETFLQVCCTLKLHIQCSEQKSTKTKLLSASKSNFIFKSPKLQQHT